MPSLQEIQKTIVDCRLCDRLVTYREEVSCRKRRAYAQDTYWGRPVPGWGDARARLLLVGLAPGAHGANRTGRMFTGDKSADFLFPALFRAGFASQPTSVSADDGQTLAGLYISNIVRCVPPENKPLPAEIQRCRVFLGAELKELPALRVILALGRTAFDQCLGFLPSLGVSVPAPRPVFAHAGVYLFGRLTLIASYHPSQRNTSTKLLTPAMLDEVFTLARSILARDDDPAD